MMNSPGKQRQTKDLPPLDDSDDNVSEDGEIAEVHRITRGLETTTSFGERESAYFTQ